MNAQALDGRTPLHLTAIHGRHARAEPLLEHGAAIDAVDKDANSPLHIAALNGHELLIRTLLSHKAEASVRRILGSHIHDIQKCPKYKMWWDQNCLKPEFRDVL